jgi:hypothetical protein
MNDIKVRVNYRTWQIIMTLWVFLLLVIVIAPMFAKYELPDIIMNFFMLVTGAVLLVFQAFEKEVTLPGAPPTPPATEPTALTPDQIAVKIQELKAIIAKSKEVTQ